MQSWDDFADELGVSNGPESVPLFCRVMESRDTKAAFLWSESGLYKDPELRGVQQQARVVQHPLPSEILAKKSEFSFIVAEDAVPQTVTDERVARIVQPTADKVWVDVRLVPGTKRSLVRFEYQWVEKQKSPPNDRKGQAERQAQQRREASDLWVQSTADLIEARHGAGRVYDTLKDKVDDDGILYDLAQLGGNTVRELLHIQTRFNRKLLDLAKKAAPRPGRLIQPKHPVQLIGSSREGTATGQLHISNDRGGELAIDFPPTMALSRDDVRIAATLTFDPPTVALWGHSETTVTVTATWDCGTGTSGTYRGELMLLTNPSDRAPVPVLMELK